MSSSCASALTHAQQNIWTGQKLHPSSPLYNMAISCRVNVALNPDTARSAWACLCIKYSALSVNMSSFDTTLANELVETSPPLEFIDLSEAGPNAYAHAVELMSEETKRCFHTDDVLTLCRLIKLGETDYIWYLKQHHIVTDAHSFSVLWEQFGRLYQQIDDQAGATELVTQSMRNERANLQLENLRYHTLQSDISKDTRTIEFWEKQSKGVAPILFGKKQDVLSTESLRRFLSIDASRQTAINNLCKLPNAASLSSQINQSTVLLSLYFSLLHRLSGETELCIDIPAANRESIEQKNDVGLYIELLPFVINLGAEDTFNELLHTVRARFIDHLMNTRPGVCKIAKSTRSIAVFNLITAHLSDETFGPISVNWHSNGHADTGHVLRLQVTDWENTGQFELAVDFKTSTFSNSQQIEFEHAWWNLVHDFSNNPDQKIGDVDLISTQNKSTEGAPHHPKSSSPQLATNPESNTSPLLLTMLQEQVASYSNDVALSCFKLVKESDSVQLSYQQLDDLSEKIAQQLIGIGLVSRTRIGIALPRSINQIVIILGILKSGACYIPLDSSQPPDRLAEICIDADVSAVITPKNVNLNFPSSSMHIALEPNDCCLVNYKDGSELIADHQLLKPQIKPADPAYILYTSGSTGIPKGVLVSHGALSNYLCWAKHFYSAGARHNYPYFTPYTFDLTVTSLFLPLITGGHLRVYPESEQHKDVGIINVLTDNFASVVKLTPAHLAMIPDQLLKDNVAKQFIVGGDDLKQAVARRVHNACNGNIEIHNEYGPTENTVGCIVHTFNPDVDKDTSVPIGHPITGVKVRVVNTLNQTQLNGVKGELLLSGDSLADGYWNNDALTKQSFIMLYEDDGTTSRYYRTGDYVRTNRLNQIVYLGRIDNQVKMNGIRVEIGDIEAKAISVDGVEDCIVKLIDHDSAQNSIESYCRHCGLSSRHPDAEFDDDELCNLCNRYFEHKETTASYFGSMEKLKNIIENIRLESNGEYDCIVLLSGGKDSSYSLGVLVDLGLKVLAFTLDNGFISDQAKTNISRVCTALNVDHVFGETEHMNDIFVDSLHTHSNVCHGCFKVVYTLSLKLAKEKNIRAIFTGLSRGQFFETRLTDELFSQKNISVKAIDTAILESRKIYHQQEDAVSKCLDVSHVRDEAIFDEIQIIDFYRYCDVDLTEMYAYLENRLPWARPDDTGRSTNCLINDVGIHVHKIERGYHNYSLPYSWDVRLGHKKRDQALHELDDELNIDNVNAILAKIGYDPKAKNSEAPISGLALYYTTKPNTSIDPLTVKTALQSTLPHWMVPNFYIPMKSLPLSVNGKIDTKNLPIPSQRRDLLTTNYRAPSTEVEHVVHKIWCEALKFDQIGVDDNYFEINGDSLKALMIVSRINQAGYQCDVSSLFKKSTISLLAKSITPIEKSEPIASESLDQPFDSLSVDELESLSAIISKSTR